MSDEQTKQNEKKQIFYVFADENGNEIARQQKGRGRPLSGSNVSTDSDGNIRVADCLATQPADGTFYKDRDVPGYGMLWLPVEKAQTPSPQMYTYDQATSSLTHDGPKGRGRPKDGYEKIETSRVIDGTNLQGHWLKMANSDAEAEQTEPEQVVEQDESEESEAERGEAERGEAEESEQVDTVTVS